MGSREQNDRVRFSSDNAEKILNVIRKWKLTFTGNNSCIPVNEFVYRVNIMTINTLDGDFEMLCKCVHVLFNDKALQ